MDSKKYFNKKDLKAKKKKDKKDKEAKLAEVEDKDSDDSDHIDKHPETANSDSDEIADKKEKTDLKIEEDKPTSVKKEEGEKVEGGLKADNYFS
jgi:hypothetical protein